MTPSKSLLEIQNLKPSLRSTVLESTFSKRFLGALCVCWSLRTTMLHHMAFPQAHATNDSLILVQNQPKCISQKTIISSSIAISIRLGEARPFVTELELPGLGSLLQLEAKLRVGFQRWTC